MSKQKPKSMDEITEALVMSETNGFWLNGNGEKKTMSPYRFFSVDEWENFKADTPLTLTEDEVKRLRSLGDPISLEEVERIYLSISRLLSAHVEASHSLYEQRQNFLNLKGHKTPFVVGIAGSVAVGKSTTARVLKELLARWPTSPKVELVTTDGFLLPNRVLVKEGIMEKKGFPESYDVSAILKFLSQIKAGEPKVRAPLYSHLTYDVLSDEYQIVDRPDILIFEGINVLQSRELPKDGAAVPFVSDYFDFSIYIDADEEDIEDWYLSRFMRLRETAFKDTDSFFHRYSQIGNEEAALIAQRLWDRTNLVNLHNNILPTRPRADLILKKGKNHLVEKVALRRL